MNELYAELAGAIIRQGMKDYKSALRGGKATRAKELEKFFLSGYGQLLSMGHGELIIERCQKEVKAGRKKKNGRSKMDKDSH